MKPVLTQPTDRPVMKNAFASFLSIFKKKVAVYFEPEEVEVTFEEGEKENGTYTYTVLPHKQVA